MNRGKSMKKILYLILIVLLISILTAGCLESNNTQANSSQSVETENPLKIYSDDTIWLSSVKDNLDDLNNTINGIYNSTNNGDFRSLQGYSEVLMMSTDLMIKQNKNFNISSKYVEANNEWLASLQDYYSGGELFRETSIDAQNGNFNKENMKKAADLCSSGTKHIQNANILIEKADSYNNSGSVAKKL
jgi:hypothetical protein